MNIRSFFCWTDCQGDYDSVQADSVEMLVFPRFSQAERKLAVVSRQPGLACSWWSCRSRMKNAFLFHMIKKHHQTDTRQKAKAEQKIKKEFFTKSRY